MFMLLPLGYVICAIFCTIVKYSFTFFQDAHELFHVLTQTLEEEVSKYPPVLSICDVKQLQVCLIHFVTQQYINCLLLGYKNLEVTFQYLYSHSEFCGCVL